MMIIKNKLLCNDGFSGKTHALSAMSMFLLITALFPKFIYGALGTRHILIYVSAVILVTGFALFPDFDNTKATVISMLGVFGIGISMLARVVSVAIFNLTRSKGDDVECDPHRGFFHTLVSAFLLGFLVYLGVIVKFKVEVPYLDKKVTVGFLFSLFWLFLANMLMLGGLLSKKGRKSVLGSIGIFLQSFLYAVIVLAFAPQKMNYLWIPFCATMGYALHLMGDLLTKQGIPFFFPFKIKGKRWWYVRIIGITSGGTVEKKVLVPLFSLIAIGSVVYMIVKPLMGK